ncbi:hypothetical protein Neosp_003148 [[Neocosmospora] mangrovei]
MSSLKNVILVGAGGKLGTLVLQAFLSSPTFKVTVLSRPTSTNTFPDGVQVIKSDYSPSSLIGAFKGQDAVVSLVGRDGYAEQRKLIDAALEAGVKRFIPSEYGNNSADPRVRALAPILEGKKTKVDFLKQHEGQMSWTVVITGAFFDWALQIGFLGFNLKARSALIYDKGVVPFSTSTLPQISRAIVAVLENPAVTANQYVYVESITVTQNQILAALKQVTGETWKVENESFGPLVTDAKERFRNGDLSAARILNLAAGLAEWEDGPYGDWSTQPGGSWNARLGLEKEDLAEVVGNLV